MTVRTCRLLCMALLGLSASPALEAQAVDSTRLGIGLGLQGRDVSGYREPRMGALAEVIMRLPHAGTGWRPRAALGVARYGTPNEVSGIVCYPDGPSCDYLAPAITLASGAVGAEWSDRPHGMRAVLALAAYHVLSAPLPLPGGGVPSPRHGVRTTEGVQMGIVVPMRQSYPRGELELRFEWLARPIESTRYFIPLIARVAW
ncbi:MAG: hypothetical protein ACYC3L_10180 [Gemmatimonadaceae bacterium]